VLFVLSKTVVIPAKTLVHSYIGFPWLQHCCESALYRLKHSGSGSVRRWDFMTGCRGLHARVRETGRNGGRFGLAPESANHMNCQSRHSDSDFQEKSRHSACCKLKAGWGLGSWRVQFWAGKWSGSILYAVYIFNTNTQWYVLIYYKPIWYKKYIFYLFQVMERSS
jgi:hypothetical protein